MRAKVALIALGLVSCADSSSPLSSPLSSGQSPVQVSGPGPGLVAPSPADRISETLHRLIALDARGAPEQMKRLVHAEKIHRVDDQVLVQINIAPGHELHEITDQLLARLGAHTITRGINLMDALVPLNSLARLTATIPAIGWVQLPRRPRSSMGSKISQGLKVTGADAFHCVESTGQGIHVAVIDLGFDQLAQAQAAGEIGTLEGEAPAPTGSHHGTACAEIIFDLAPGVILHPIAISSLAQLQQVIKELPGSGIQLISSSLVWTEDSFSDGTGPHCEMVELARQAGILWITSAGNQGNGTFYVGEITAENDNGWHEFALDDEVNELELSAQQQTRIVLDWDAYPATDQDYDLFLFHKQGETWEQVATSSEDQSGAAPPFETLSYTAEADGTYGIKVKKRAGARAGMAFRLFLFPALELKMEHWQRTGSLMDPAHCADVLAVGASSWSAYEGEAIVPYSSQGPTWDGRIKPDILAPAEVLTSTIPTFFGTSAAAPHVAAAVALIMKATGADPFQAAQLLLDHARPLGDPIPNNISGHGRLILDGTLAGWQCEPETSGTCTTTCGSQGLGTCGPGCTWASCSPPSEICDGVDQDCDGQADNGFSCASDAHQSCTTTCGSQGEQVCDATCAWGECRPPAEICNDRDDDCDGAVDEELSCPDADAQDGCASVGAPAHVSTGWIVLLLGAFIRRRLRTRSEIT